MTDGAPLRITETGKMIPQVDGSALGRTRASLAVPQGPNAAFGTAVCFGTAIALPGDHDHVYIEL